MTIQIINATDKIIEVVKEGVQGREGVSAYQVALNNGFIGTEAEWLESLIGPVGTTSIDDNSYALDRTWSADKISGLFETAFATDNTLQESINSKVSTSALGVTVPTLVNGTVPSNQLPSYVDDVIEFTNLAAFPVTGEVGKIYVSQDTNKTYRWSGSTYVYITSGAVDSVNGKTGVVTLAKADVGLANVDNTTDVNKNVLSATKLTTARTISISGDISGSVSFDGTSNANINATLANSGVTAGTYKSVTIDSKGRVIGGSNPTTLGGYGITDALPITGGTITGDLNISGAGSITTLKVNNGTAAAPSLSFLSDPDTGIYKPANDTFAISTMGSEKLRIDAYGNVGLGRTPTYSLDVGNDVGQQIIRLNGGAGSGNAAGSALYLKNGTSTHALGNYSAIAGGAYDADLALWSGSGSTRFYTGSYERMRIDANGNVSISNSGGAPKRLTVDGSIGLPLGQSISFLNGVSSAYVADWAIRNVYDTVDRLQLQPSGASTGEISLYTGPAAETRTERMRIDKNGNVGIGDSNPTGWNSKFLVAAPSGYVQSTVLSVGSTGSDIAAHVVTASGGNYGVTTQAYGDGFVQTILNGAAGKDRQICIHSRNVLRWALVTSSDAESGSNAGSNLFIARYADNGTYLGAPLKFYRSTGDAFFDGHITCNVDNLKNLGGAALRWGTLYAGTGTINTSDAREKTEVRSLTSNEILAAQALSKEIGAYKFLKSIEEKGDAAREHIGMTVQRAIEVMESFGLVPFNYGFICYDEWDQETETIPAVEAVEEVLDEQGNVVVPAVEAKQEEIKVIREAGNRYSFRMDELMVFIARGIVADLEDIKSKNASIEARLDAIGA